MECLLFTFYIFEMYKEKKLINCNNLTEFVKTETKNRYITKSMKVRT